MCPLHTGVGRGVQPAGRAASGLDETEMSPARSRLDCILSVGLLAVIVDNNNIGGQWTINRKGR